MNIRSLLIIAFSFFIAAAAQAQWNVVRETERMMSFGNRPGYHMEFAKTDAKIVEKVWRDYAKKNFSAKLKKRKGEWAANKLRASFMGDDQFSIYSIIGKDGDKSTLTVWIDAGAYFLNSRDNRNRSEEVLRSLQQCYFDIRRAAIGEDLDNEEKSLKSLENDQKKLQKENDSLHKDIDSWKARIQKAEQDLENNVQEQETNLVDQEAQRRKVEEVRRRMQNVENEGGN